MPISDSIKIEMQKVNGLFGETVVKGRNFAIAQMADRQRSPADRRGE